MNEYYGCEIVKDEEAYKLEYLFTDKNNFLNFIKQLRKVTKSNEPLILLPTRRKGKSSSAKMGSCHWAVTKMIEQHLGKKFCGYTILTSSVSAYFDATISIDNKINCLSGYFHTAWLTPEEKAVNLINYVDKTLEENPKLKKIKDFLEFEKPNPFLFLPTNKHCYFKTTPQGEYTYNNVIFFHKRKKSVLENKIIKKIKKKTNIELLPDNTTRHPWGEIENPKDNLIFNKIVMAINFGKEISPTINTITYVRNNYPKFFDTIFSTDFKNNFRSFLKYLPKTRGDEITREINKRYNSINNDWLFHSRFNYNEDSQKYHKDLFSKPSLISKKYHYEQGNHPLFDDRIEYRTIDKSEVNDEIETMINNMSQSQKNYEIKRAEKKGITLEQHILRQKFKLSN